MPPAMKKIVPKCPGTFCNINWNKRVFSTFHDDDMEITKVDYWGNINKKINEEAKNANKIQEITKLVEYKSIILNKEELAKILEKYDDEDPMMLKFRKCNL